MAEAQARVPGVEARAGKFPGPSLIPALNAIQERVGWLPREELVALSREVHRPLYEIEGLISFYPHFRTDPPQRVQLRVCHDLSCWLRGADERIAALRERYGADADVELVEGSCIGRCDIAPAGTVNEAPVPMDAADAAVTTAKETAPADGYHATAAGTANAWHSMDEAAVREDWLCAFAQAGWPTPCARDFAEQGLAQRVVSWLCRLYANTGLRCGVRTVEQVSDWQQQHRDDVRGSGAVALSPFAHR